MRERITVHVGTNGGYWQVHWTDQSGRRCRRSLGPKSKLSRRQATAKARRIEDQISRSPDEQEKRREPISLQEFLDLYFAERTRDSTSQSHRRLKRYGKLSPGTVTMHRMTGRYLLEFFGPDQDVAGISKLDALQWLKALESGKLAGARKSSKRTYAGLSEQSICKEIRNVKAIFGWAVAYEIAEKNPFSEFNGAPAETHGSGHHVSMEDFHKLTRACTNHGWVTLIGLCRLAGLRRGEALGLVWSGRAVDRDGAERWIGVDFERNRICLVAVKTSKHREIPIVPELQAILAKQYTQAQEGESLVVPHRQVSRNNLRVRLLRIVESAGLARWPKLFQTLRSSRENQWKTQGIPEATYSAWLGHSIEVSRKHYVQPLDSEFDRVTQLQEKVSQKVSQTRSSDSPPHSDRAATTSTLRP